MLTLKDWLFISRRILTVSLFWGAAAWFVFAYRPDLGTALANWLTALFGSA